MHSRIFAVALTLCLHVAASDRVNQEGRKLPPLPKFTQPVLFNTPEGDAILSAMQIMPLDNPWNQDISKRPVLANSDAMIAKIGAAKVLKYNLDMAFVLVP